MTVSPQPGGQTCTVANGSGTIAGADVTNVAVSCTTVPTFFFTGYCVVDDVTGQLTGMCFDPGNCFGDVSPYCSGSPLAPVVGAFCGPSLDQTFCLF